MHPLIFSCACCVSLWMDVSFVVCKIHGQKIWNNCWYESTNSAFFLPTFTCKYFIIERCLMVSNFGGSFNVRLLSQLGATQIKFNLTKLVQGFTYLL